MGSVAGDTPALGPNTSDTESTAPRGSREAALDAGDLLPSLLWDTGLGTWPSYRDAVPGGTRPRPAVGQGVAAGEQPLPARREDNVTFSPINEDFGL